MAEKRRKALYEALKENEKVRVQFSPFGGSGSSSSVQQSRLVQPSSNVGLMEFDCMSRVSPLCYCVGLSVIFWESAPDESRFMEY